MTTLKFQDPPVDPRRSPRGTWDSIREALKARPGEWAVVAENVHPSNATRAKRPGYEFTTRRRSDGPKCDIYGRYVGGES